MKLKVNYFILIVTICLSVVCIVNNGCRHRHRVHHELNQKVVYTCEMHPEVISDKPGKCPKCGMELIKK